MAKKKKKKSCHKEEMDQMQSMIEHLLVVTSWVKKSRNPEENMMALHLLFKSAEVIMRAAMISPLFIEKNMIELRENAIMSMMAEMDIEPSI